MLYVMLLIECEGYHNRLGKVLHRQRPSIWCFIRAIKDEESLTVRSALSANRGVDPPRRRLKYRKLECRIQKLKQEYSDGDKSLSEYWQAMSHVIGSFV